eukprot:m.20830 g.20830  ORF g.20830 m.20830 type:complete len:73 (+) comp28095_c0_seq2:920-1138(+)
MMQWCEFVLCCYFQVVISNLLDTRGRTVTLVFPDEEKMLRLSDDELHGGMQIEMKIVDTLSELHKAFLSCTV